MGEIYKGVSDNLLIFDTEYVPCLETIKRIYHIDDENATPQEILEVCYQANGATKEDPVPMIKFLFYKVVAISGLYRKVTYNRGDTESGKHKEVSLQLFSLPRDLNCTFNEGEIIQKFFQSIGRTRPQICGWAINQFDLNVLFQRAVINRCIIPEFCLRPNKPWEGSDYFSNKSDSIIDLMEAICGWGSKSRARLDEMASACGIPGKLGIEGSQICGVYYGAEEGSHQRIIDYCETDVGTTYLLWLETALVSGHVNEEEYLLEKNQFYDFVKYNEKPQWKKFLDAWDYFPGDVAGLQL